MNAILDGLKTLGLEYSNGTKGTLMNIIKTWKKGIVPPKPVYPMIAFVPRYEIYHTPKSGGVYRVDRYIDIEVYVMIRSQNDMGKVLQTISTNVLEMFYDTFYPDNYKLTTDSVDLTFHFDSGRIGYLTFALENQMIQKATIPMMFSSWESAPAYVKATSIADTSVKSIGEYLYTTLAANINLNQVKF
jgi:hypothetical protein